MKNILLFFVVAVAGIGCAVRHSYNPARKYAPRQLQEDYAVFRQILEESHPSLYWYTPKDSIDYYFDWGARQLTDSLPEYKFRNILSYVIAKFRCGHTSVRPSAAAARYAENTRSMALPLGIKAWPDTVLVTVNLNRKDSVVTRGAVLKSIEGRPIQTIVDSFFSHLSGDGFNTTHKYQTLSNGGTFRNLYGAIYGLRPKMKVEFVDTMGRVSSALVDIYNPAADSGRTRPPAHRPSARERRKMQLQAMRSLRLDTALRTAFMELNGFSKSVKLRQFFRRSFRKMRQEKIQNLVIDLRGNGGGSVILSNLLTKYIADRPFKIADSIYALKRKSSYSRYIENYFQSRLFLLFIARRKIDDYYQLTI